MEVECVPTRNVFRTATSGKKKGTPVTVGCQKILRFNSAATKAIDYDVNEAEPTVSIFSLTLVPKCIITLSNLQIVNT